VLRHITIPNFVKIGQSVVKILQFIDLKWWLLPSCLSHIWTAHRQYLGFAITLQNSVMINAVVLIK